jgi:hypothetical protein
MGLGSELCGVGFTVSYQECGLPRFEVEDLAFKVNIDKESSLVRDVA